MPPQRLKDKVQQARPQNRSRIVVEGIDEPKREGTYSDRIKIDPFSPTYKWPALRKPLVSA